MKTKKVRIAIQSNGRLSLPSLEYLKSRGLQFSANGRNLLVPCVNKNFEILYVRNGDIPTYVDSGVADFGIVGANIFYEAGRKLDIVRKLEFGQCGLVIAVKKDSSIMRVEQLEGERIATTYPNLLKKYLKQKKINASIIEISGSVEIAPALDLADAICDLTQTGKTIQENNLRIIDVVMQSQALLIRNFNNKYDEKILL